MPKSRNGKIATGLAGVAFFFVLIAFATPSWLVSDGYLPNPKMEQIGRIDYSLGVSPLFVNSLVL